MIIIDILLVGGEADGRWVSSRDLNRGGKYYRQGDYFDVPLWPKKLVPFGGGAFNDIAVRHETYILKYIAAPTKDGYPSKLWFGVPVSKFYDEIFLIWKVRSGYARKESINK